MKIRFTSTFHADYLELPSKIREALEKKFRLLVENIRHPSLRAKKMEGYSGIWGARISKQYRFTFKIEGEMYLLRRVGPHDILRHP